MGYWAAGAFAAGLLTTNALAADMPVKAPVATPAPVAACTWCGFYIGIHGGYGWGHVDASIDGVGISPVPEPKGWFGGMQAGYNWMMSPNWLLGLETDISVGSIRDTVSLFSIPGVVSFDASSELENFGTFRGRVGYTQGSWLLYATGGLAWGRNQVITALNIPGIFSFQLMHDHQTHFGWTAGGGVEWAMTPHWTAKVEYLYADLGSRDYDFVTPLIPALSHKETLQTVKVGINYLFGERAAAPIMPTKAPMMASCTWCGVYGGIHGGYGWGHVDASIAGFDVSPVPEPKGGFGGMQVGYNWMMSPNWLVGLESDLSIGSIRDTVSLFSIPNTFSLDATSNIEFFGTLRGRVGYAQGPWLLYATGGLAWARNEVTTSFNIPGTFEFVLLQDHQTHFGWTAGGGVEWALSPNWSTKVEYLYADLGSRDYDFVTPFIPPVSHKETLQTVKLGLNYRLGSY
jgi:outer membrane immunogenic protein